MEGFQVHTMHPFAYSFWPMGVSRSAIQRRKGNNSAARFLDGENVAYFVLFSFWRAELFAHVRNHAFDVLQEAFQELADLNGATSVAVTFGQEAPHLQLSAKGSIGSR